MLVGYSLMITIAVFVKIFGNTLVISGLVIATTVDISLLIVLILSSKDFFNLFKTFRL